MKLSLNRMRLTAVVLAAGASLSCAESMAPPSSQEQANPALLGDLVETTTSALTGLLYCPHDKSYSGAKTIGPDGGTLKVGPHTLEVPRAALSSSVRITADAPAGDHVLVHFEPAGLTFSRQPTLTLSYKECGLLAIPLAIVYADDGLNILEVLKSVNNLLSRTMSAKIKHFSNYALAD